MAEMIVGSYVLAGKVSLLFSQIMKKVAHCHALWMMYPGWQSESFVPTEESLLPCQSPRWQLICSTARGHTVDRTSFGAGKPFLCSTVWELLSNSNYFLRI